ncbi:MAG: hypothetical protein J6D08_16820 [Lachnospiraceae bacterium]|nr:hypothetical protein [Lachnospiraceae bacterium]
MTGKDLLEDIGYISDALIEEAVSGQPGNRRQNLSYQRWGKMAACAAAAAVSAAVIWTHTQTDRFAEDLKEGISADLNMETEAVQEMEAVSQNEDGTIADGDSAEKMEQYDVQADTGLGNDGAEQSQELYASISSEDSADMDPQIHSAQLEADSRTIIDTFPPGQTTQSEEQGGAACYKAPEKGEWVYFHQLQNAFEYYDGAWNTIEESSPSVYVYQVVIGVFGDRTETDNEEKRIVYGELNASDDGRELLEAEYRRLLELGYQVSLSEDYLLTGTFTKAELEEFQASPDYGYAFYFENEY